jgi:hypothetical protein
MSSLPNQQQHQMAMKVAAAIAQSRESEKERLSKRIDRASIVTGGCLARRAEGGTILENPCLV